MRILIVEDEVYLAEAVAHVLKKAGYSVDLAHDGEEGLKKARGGTYDLLILDIMMPKLDGLGVLKRVRAEGMSTPVIMLSAKGEIEDKVIGLDGGADDYLAKPFKTVELLARVRALLRRGEKVLIGKVLECGDIVLDLESMEIGGAEKKFRLTAKEFILMETLVKQAGKVVKKEFLFKKIWGGDAYTEDNYVEVYVSFLRKKLKELGSKTTIGTVRGIGYRLDV